MADIDIKSFRAGFNGQVYEPADVGYDEARQIWNASVCKHPKVIARCSGVADVIAAVDFARANDRSPKTLTYYPPSMSKAKTSSRQRSVRI